MWWIHRLSVNRILSDQVCSSTGSPQGCLLSHLLLIVYTNMWRSRYGKRPILKPIQMAVIVSRLQDDETSHSCSRRRLCELVSCLQLNVSKTKDMIVDFRRRAHTHEPLCNHLWKSNLRPFAGIGAAPVSYLACCWIRAQCHSDSEAVAESADLLIASWGTDGAVIRVIMKSDHLPLSVQTYHLVSKFKTRGLMFRLHP